MRNEMFAIGYKPAPCYITPAGLKRQRVQIAKFRWASEMDRPEWQLVELLSEPISYSLGLLRGNKLPKYMAECERLASALGLPNADRFLDGERQTFDL